MFFNESNVMALAYQSNVESLFDQGSFSFESHPANLQKEAFIGELSLLRQQSDQLEQMIEAMPTGVVMLDGNGIVVKVNKVAGKLLDEPILGQQWFDVIRRSFKPRADDWHEVSLKDGRRVKLEITALAHQPGQLITITDMTETRLMQDKISQMQRLSSLGKMVSSLAHQIRTPLSAAMLYGANLANANLATDAQINFQQKLMFRLQELEQQVNDMLLFAKSGGKQVVTDINLNTLVKQVINSMDAIIQKAQAEVIIHTTEHACHILGNETALIGAIQNLVQNAIQANDSGIEITINIECHNQHVYLSVKDNGKGIDAQLADKIFEPFYTSKVQGTGLGLAVVKTVVNAHQGQVKLIYDGHPGANFCIKLPLLGSDESLQGDNDSQNYVSPEVIHDS